MKLLAVGVIALVTLVEANGAPSAGTTRSANIARTYAGIQCNWLSNVTQGLVVCRRADRRGYAGGVAQRFVMVTTVATRRWLFIRNQPRKSPGFAPVNDKRIFHSETHRGISCAWSRLDGGGALCWRADRHGYVVGVSHSHVLVLNEGSQIVYSKNQPV
jgi:hypothetical protein